MNETETDVPLCRFYAPVIRMFHLPILRSMMLGNLSPGNVLLCHCAVFFAVLLHPGTVYAWQGTSSSDLSDSPIQSERVNSRQSQLERLATEIAEDASDGFTDSRLDQKVVDRLLESRKAAQIGEFINPNGPAVLQKTLDGGGQLQLPRTVDVPFSDTPLPVRTVVQEDDGLVTLLIRDASLGAVLNALAEEMSLNIVTAGAVVGQISMTLHRVPLDDALDAILNVNGYCWVKEKDIIMVSSMVGGSELPPGVQGRVVRVFRLNFASAEEINTIVQGLLSPIGNSFVTTVSDDKLRTREELVVEDLPEYLSRVETYVAQADEPPMQVLIEAHVLRVVLRDDDQHGVDLTLLARLASANVTLSSNGIVSSAASPAFLLNVDSTDLQALVEMIKTTTDAKTLASPKVMAVNGQKARLQIGERLGYLTTTTTETSTLQDVQFMDLGVVLTVTPIISQDGRILMTVEPEVSSGRINPATGVPDAETTDVETTVLLSNGQGMVIGGLIQEENSDQQNKVPYVGDIPVFGRLFQRRVKVKERSEIIITLLPRIVPYCEPLAQVTESEQLQRAHAPLTYGPLLEVDRRRLEPSLPTATGRFHPPGRSMDRFPTPVGANSSFGGDLGNGLRRLPSSSGPPVRGLQHIVPVPSEEYLPPVSRQPSTNESDVQQTSGVRSGGWKRARATR